MSRFVSRQTAHTRAMHCATAYLAAGWRCCFTSVFRAATWADRAHDKMIMKCLNDTKDSNGLVKVYEPCLVNTDTTRLHGAAKFYSSRWCVLLVHQPACPPASGLAH